MAAGKQNFAFPLPTPVYRKPLSFANLFLPEKMMTSPYCKLVWYLGLDAAIAIRLLNIALQMDAHLTGHYCADSILSSNKIST